MGGQIIHKEKSKALVATLAFWWGLDFRDQGRASGGNNLLKADLSLPGGQVRTNQIR